MSKRSTSASASSLPYGLAVFIWGLIVPVVAAQPATRPAHNEQQAQNPQRRTTTIGSGAITSAEALTRDPRQHYGKVVMVEADVARVLSPHAFLLDEDAAFAGPDILVLVPSGAKAITSKGEVRITGTVRPFVRADLEREFDWFDDQTARDLDLRGRPVIVAESVRGAAGGELAGALLQKTISTPVEERPIALSAGELAAAPEQYAGKRVTVRAEVEDVHNRQLFTLDEDRLFVGPDVIVYARDGRAIVEDDQIVTVTGRVRSFVDTDLFGSATWFEPWFNDLDATGRGLVRSRPVVVAESIRSTSGSELYRSGSSSSGAKDTMERATDGMQERAKGTTGADPAKGSFELGSNVTTTGTIQSMANDRAFWLTVDGRSDPIMVIVNAAHMAAMPGWTPAANQRVTVKGSIKAVPGHSGAVTVSDWGLPAEHAKRFSQQRVYIYADSMSRSEAR